MAHLFLAGAIVLMRTGESGHSDRHSYVRTERSRYRNSSEWSNRVSYYHYGKGLHGIRYMDAVHHPSTYLRDTKLTIN